MIRYYPTGLARVLDSTISLTSDPLGLVLTTTGHVFDPDDEVLTDLTHTQGSLVAVGTVSIATTASGAFLTVPGPVTMPVDPDGDGITGIVVVCSNLGVDHLLTHVDRTADGVAFSRSASDGDIAIEFVGSVIYGLGG